MDSFASYPEYLRSLKNRPVNRNRRITSRQLRVNKRDELRASKRTFSPMPPTPHKTASVLKHTEETTKTKTKMNATGGTTRRLASAEMSTEQKVTYTEKPSELRMQRLLKWREERDRKRAMEKASQKPVFKVSRHVEIPPMSVFNKPLASDNYIFKAPQNVRPIPSFQYGVIKKKESAVKASKLEVATKKGQNQEKNEVLKPAFQPLLSTRRKLNYQSEEDVNETKAGQMNKVDIGRQPVKRVTRQTSSTVEQGIKTRSKNNKAIQVDVQENVPEAEARGKRRVLKKQQHVDSVEDDRVSLMQVSEDISPISQVKPVKTPVKTPRGRKSRALSESDFAYANQNGEEVEKESVQFFGMKVNEGIRPISHVRSAKTPVKTPRGRKSRALSESGVVCANQNGGEEVDKENIQLVGMQVNEGIRPIGQIKTSKTPVKTSRGRQSRAFSESGDAYANKNSAEEIDKANDQLLGMQVNDGIKPIYQVKSAKTPVKTPRGRKSCAFFESGDAYANKNGGEEIDKANDQLLGLQMNDGIKPICQVKSAKTPVKTPRGRKSRALSESGASYANQNGDEEVDRENVQMVGMQLNEGIRPIGQIKSTKTPVKTPRGRKSHALSEFGIAHANQNGGEEVDKENVHLVGMQANGGINSFDHIKSAKTPVKTPRGRKSHAFSKSAAVNVNQNGGEDVEDGREKILVKELVFKSPVKTPKTPKTPRVKGRKSAGRTPARRLRKSELDLDTEDNEDEACGKLTATPEELNSASTIYPCDNLDSTFTIEETSADDAAKTPENQVLVEPVVYVSPFVTMSRGKKSARSEYKSRATKGGESLNSPETTGTKAGSAYFCQLLDDEIVRIQGVCEQWEAYKLAENLPEEAINMINVPIGQSKLLISKKMQQFRALIDKSVHSTDDLTVTCTDLHGFWETVMIQVRNLNKRFENLVKLRDNAWEEVLCVETRPKQRVLPKRRAKTIAASKPESKIRDAIRAARTKKKQAFLAVNGEDNVEFDGGFYSIRSPVKNALRAPIARTPTKTPGKDKPLLVTALHNQNRKSVKGSPGLAMIKATQSAKICSGVDGEAGAHTPTKSILKMATPRSTVKKAVIFKEKEAEVVSFERNSDEEDEDLALNPLENLQRREDEEENKVAKRTPRRADAREPPRRSKRLSSRPIVLRL